jgi:hypothetical protein
LSRLNVAVIVEGHGENSAVALLLRNLWTFLGGEHCNVLTPIRRSRGKLLKPDDPDMGNAIQLALRKLAAVGGGLVLILLDAEEDCQRLGSLGPLTLRRAKQLRGDVDIACVIANVMYETWLVASADSLGRYLDLGSISRIPDEPEQEKAGKSWIKRYIRSASYSPSIDQARLTSGMDFSLCRMRSPSFDKLCRELESRITISE